jgi:hypothetical protein
MKGSILIAQIFWSAILFAQESSLLPNRTALESVYEFATDTSATACFRVKKSNAYYIVTAKHAFKRKVKSGDTVSCKIKIEGKIFDIRRRVYFHSNPAIDVAVMPVNIVNTSKEPIEDLPLMYNGAALGQECYFLGYPLNQLGTKLESQTIPFVKKGYVSAFYKEKDFEMILLDAHNNPGFSGGPVISYSDDKDKLRSQYILGVVSGYYWQGNPHTFENLSPIRYLVKGTVRENSGILIAYPSDYITEIINSIGNK